MGKGRAATRAREAAYTVFEPLIKSTENNLLTTVLPKLKETGSEKNEKPFLTKLIGNPKEEPKLENALYRVGEHGKTQIENALYRVGENEKSQLENALYRVGEHGKMQIENALNHVGENEKSQLKNALYQVGEDSRITKLKNAAFRQKDNEKEETSSFGNNAPKPDEALSEIKKSGKMTGLTRKKEKEYNKNSRYVRADILNMRSAPGIDSKIVRGLPNGTEVHYTGNKTEEIDGHLWAEITYDGKTGWVAADYLKTEKPRSLSSNNSQNDSVSTSVTSKNPVQFMGVESDDKENKIDINDYAALQAAFNEVRKPGVTSNDSGEPGDFDGVYGLQCVDLPNWFLTNYTTLDRVNGNGKDIVQNIANKHNLEVTTTPTAPAVFSIKEGTYGPGIRTGGVSDENAGHTGIALDVKDLGDDLYEITYMDTYNELKNNEYNSNIRTKTFKKSDNVTYVNLKEHLK